MNPVEPVMAWAMGPTHPRWTETLHDERQVLIRPVCKDDVEAERAFIAALSPEGRRYRFLGQMSKPSPEQLRHLTDLDYDHEVAFAAIEHADETGPFVAVGRYSTSDDGSQCECAVSVLESWQHQGLGSVLMKHLIEVARARGIKSMWSVDSAQNSQMADLARSLGFKRRAYPDDSTLVLHELWL